jgi:hypothetical protein
MISIFPIHSNLETAVIALLTLHGKKWRFSQVSGCVLQNFTPILTQQNGCSIPFAGDDTSGVFFLWDC